MSAALPPQNFIPIASQPDEAGGYLLPEEQGDILTTSILRESGAVALAGNVRRTTARRTQFTVWLGQPTAGPVGEGAPKPVTGAAFGQATLDVKKFASIVLFTDEMLEDVQGGDLNVLVDSGVRGAIDDSIDAYAIGMAVGADLPNDQKIFGPWNQAGQGFLRDTTNEVTFDPTSPDGLALAISAAMAQLEEHGMGRVTDMGLLLGFGFAQLLRDTRVADDEAAPLYSGPGALLDPFYGITIYNSTNLPSVGTAPGGSILGFLAYRPNLFVRLRRDVTLSTSRDATVNDGVQDRHLWQEDLTAIRYDTRLAYFVHDLDASVIAIRKAV